MAKRLSGECYALKILNLLIRSEKGMSTNQLIDHAGCERKTVYKSIEMLEVSGWGVEISRTRSGQNIYKTTKTYGLG